MSQLNKQSNDFFSLCKEQYKGVFKTLTKYFRIYGGWRAMLASPYFHIAIIVTLLSNWYATEGYMWYDAVINVSPDILGFTFAGFAILLTFGEDVKAVICGPEKDKASPFMVNIAAITHFLVLQSLSLCLALFAEMFSLKTGFFAFCGTLLFVYSILSVVAAILATFRIARYVDMIVDPPEDE